MVGNNSSKIILGIETSCDETAASVIEGIDGKIKVLSNVVSSQIEIHKKYGGVVPEVAAREHVLNILPVVNEALVKAGMHLTPTLSFVRRGGKCCDVDGIAVTVGPGLITSLIVGVETAKTLGYVWNIPTIAVNHIEGHIYSNFIDNSNIKFPALILTVSGGHTILVLMKGHGKYQVIGETRDDAAGEAFDKAAQLMKIGYPGGPVVSTFAEKFQISNDKFPKNAKSVNLPRPMINSADYDFSFSGLKTALRYELEKDKDWRKKIPEYCHEFQQAVIDVFIAKTIKAAKQYKAKTILLSGGVSANKELRLQLEFAVKDKLVKTDFYVPDLKYTTDNAVMIAVNGYYKTLRKKYAPWHKLRVDCNLEL
jgi:N6-L-threonylcarbamoyladenine synthase